MEEEQSPNVRQFLQDIIALCKKHKLILGHEDHHGAFTVEKYSTSNEGWLLNAADLTNDPAF